MKIAQNNTWLRCLIIGVVISTLGFSCGKTVELARFGEFYFVNNTGHNITFEYNAPESNQERMGKYAILPKSTTIVKQVQDSNPTATALDFFVPFIQEYGFREPLIIKFDDTRCLNATRDSERTPLNIANYASEELGKRKYKFTYTFTEVDYEKAEVCP